VWLAWVLETAIRYEGIHKMKRNENLTSSEQYVCRLIKDRFGIFLRKIGEMGGAKGKKPDFEYAEDGKRIFVCELKDYVAITPSEIGGWDLVYHLDGSEEATRKSNAPNSISRNIYDAYKQLRNYNEPKILIFLNHGASLLGVNDLDDTYRGYFEFSAGDRRFRDYYAKRASEGDIKDIKSKIDLYIWIDKANPPVSDEGDEIFFRTVTDEGKEIVKKYFGMDIE
jgi:hypothetical protein